MRGLDQLFFDRRFPREKPSKQKKAPETSVLSLQRSRNRSERMVVVREPFREFEAAGRPRAGRLPICSFLLTSYLCFQGVLHGSSATQGGDIGARARAVTLQHCQNEPERRELLCVVLANVLLPVTAHALVLHRAETEHRVPSPLGLIHS